jgi:hypothetical protein
MLHAKSQIWSPLEKFYLQLFEVHKVVLPYLVWNKVNSTLALLRFIWEREHRRNKGNDHNELRNSKSLKYFPPKPAVHVCAFNIFQFRLRLQKPQETKETISALPTSIAFYCSLFKHLIMTFHVTTIFTKFLLSYRNHVIKVTLY